MIDTIATRKTTLNGKPYAKGDTVRMPAQQFEDLEPTKRFERPAATKAVSTAKTTETKSSPAAD